MALSQRTDWHRAYQNAQGTTVYSEYDDGTIGLVGIHFADGTFQNTAAANAIDSTTAFSTTSPITFGTSVNVMVQATGGVGGITLTLPSAIGASGQSLRIKKVDTGVGSVTLNTVLSQTIDGALFGTSYLLSNYMQYVVLESDGSNWFIFGNN